MSDTDLSPDIDEEDEAGAASDDVVARAQRLYQQDKNHWNPIYTQAKLDLDFLSDDEDAQWPDDEYKERSDAGKPAITMDYLTQFVHQVANNIRMNTPSINPIPGGDGSSIATAKKLKGLIRKIEYKSCADAVYDNAATQAVKSSIGFARVDHDFVSDDSDIQELKILKVINQFMIYMDCETIESDGRDQNHCNCLESIKVSKFKKEWPDAEISSFDDENAEEKEYTDEDEIIISEFFEKVTTKEKAKDAKGRTRTKSKTVIKRYRLSGVAVLEETTFPGIYIPVIPFYGEEAWNNGKRRIHSLIRKSRMAQYMFNLMQSVQAELLLKQPLAPVTSPAGMVENYADDWKNPSKTMVLRYDTTDADGNQLSGKPERLSPPEMSAGFAAMSEQSVDNIKATMGLYNENTGEGANDQSGKAINARKIQGDVATFHFGDNAVRSITQIGRVIVSARKEVYDTKREISIINEEDKPESVGINGHRVEGQTEDHNMTEGDYDVRVITGASFTTRRQESASFFQDLIKTNPQMLNICGDLLFKNMDIEGSQEMAARMEKIISPQLLQTDGDDKDPQVVALQRQLQQAQQIIQQGSQELQALQTALKDKTTMEQGKLQNEAGRNQIAMLEAQNKGTVSKVDMLVKLMTLAINDRKNDITEQNNAGNLAIAQGSQSFDQMMQIINALNAALPSDDMGDIQSELPSAPMTGNTSAANGGVSQGMQNV